MLQVDDANKISDRAQAINVDGPRFLAEAAAKTGARSSFISARNTPSRGNRSDGRLTRSKTHRSRSTSMDEPKSLVRLLRSWLAREAYIIRTSWVFGSGKASFLCDVHESLRAGKKVRAIDDIWSSTTYVEDLDRSCSVNRWQGAFRHLPRGQHRCVFVLRFCPRSRPCARTRACANRFADRDHSTNAT